MTDPASPSTTGDANRSQVNRDPAVEAAQRECTCAGTVHSSRCLVTAAREALKPIRELHRRYGSSSQNGFCRHCEKPWPCATARLIYTTEELGQ